MAFRQEGRGKELPEPELLCDSLLLQSHLQLREAAWLWRRGWSHYRWGSGSCNTSGSPTPYGTPLPGRHRPILFTGSSAKHFLLQAPFATPGDSGWGLSLLSQRGWMGPSAPKVWEENSRNSPPLLNWQPCANWGGEGRLAVFSPFPK